MELKKFSEYSKEEQKNLLLHWWFYYGKSVFSLDELECFEKIIDDDAQHAFDMAVVAFINNNDSSILLSTMRAQRFEELEKIVRDIVSNASYLERKEAFEGAFLREIVTTLNNDSDNMEKQGISERVVCELYRSCLFNSNEIKDGIPTEDFSIGEGIKTTAIFNSKRLNEHKEKIVNVIDHIHDIYLGPHFLQLCVDDNGLLWTGNHGVVDQLVQLGIATGVLEYTVPREMWEYLPEGLPYVCVNKEKIKTEVVGQRPSEFAKIIGKYRKQ